MSEPKLGSTILGIDETRDAIHIAIIPALVADKTWPGNHVGIDSLGRASEQAMPKVGIIDPFLTGAVYPGQSCWIIIYPGTVTNLKHIWSHPVLDERGFAPPPIEEPIGEDPIDYGDQCQGC